MRTNRPVFLELWRIKLPPPGLVSILHRISGIAMVLAIPAAAILFHRALSGPEGFAATAALLDSWLAWPILVLLLWSLLHHWLAGIRHLVLDAGVGLERRVARHTARVAVIMAPALVVVLVALGGFQA